MSRSLTVLFRRDPSKDRQADKIRFDGYKFLWPDGTQVAVGLDAFCKVGTRFFGLHRLLVNCSERLIKLVFLPKPGRDEDLTKIPGFRVRRLYMERQGLVGRVHLLDGTPTNIVFDLGRDEEVVLDWLGLPDMDDGEQQWFDIAAMPVEVPFELPSEMTFKPRQMAVEVSSS